MTKSSINYAKSQRGVTLVEAVAAIGIMAGMMVLAVTVSNSYTDDATDAVTAQQVKTFGEAARAHINANQAALLAGSTATIPAVVTGPDLIASGVLSAGTSTVNNRGQTMCLQVLQPSPGKLEGMVVAHGGDALDDITARKVAKLIGAAGGAVLAEDVTKFFGTQGGWSMPLGGYGVRDCGSAVIAGGPGAGRNVMALWAGGDNTATAFLYRDAIAGQPELNTMNTNIDMGGYRILNLQSVAIDTACGAGVNTGDVARTADGKVVSCQGGVWKGGSAFWGDPVDQAVAMPACTAANVNEVRVRFGYAAAPTRRLFSCDGTSWVAVGVDHAGDLTVPGNLSVNTLVVNRTVGEGGACSPNGAVARDSAGLLLSCRSLEWRRWVNWSTAAQVVGSTCAAYGPGSLAHDSVGDLLQCRP